MIQTRENGRPYTVCYTGDIGRFNKPILKDPTLSFGEKETDIDLLVMESTYGDRIHEPVKDIKNELKQAGVKDIAIVKDATGYNISLGVFSNEVGNRIFFQLLDTEGNTLTFRVNR